MDSSKGSTASLPTREKILIRRMQPADIPFMASIACTEYFDSDLNEFLCPHRHEYPQDLMRRFVQMIQGRYLNPRSIGFVAVSASAPSPGNPVAYAQFIRLGNDEAARRLISAQSSLWRTVQRWWATIRTRIENFLRPDRSADVDALRKLEAADEIDRHQYWDSADMKARYENRWHTQSVVVSSAYQRQGIGRRLMEEVLRRAQDERVVVGLEASGDGEKLYRRLGFELRGRFSMIIGPVVGGIMMWSPRQLH